MPEAHRQEPEAPQSTVYFEIIADSAQREWSVGGREASQVVSVMATWVAQMSLI